MYFARQSQEQQQQHLSPSAFQSRKSDCCRYQAIPRSAEFVARLISLMLLHLPVMPVNIEWQDQHGRWHHLQSQQNQTDAYRVAMRRAEATGKRHRLVDGDGRLLELLAA